MMEAHDGCDSILKVSAIETVFIPLVGIKSKSSNKGNYIYVLKLISYPGLIKDLGLS